VDKFALGDITTPPFYQHVFLIKSFEDLEKASDVIAEKDIGGLLFYSIRLDNNTSDTSRPKINCYIK